MRNSPRNILPSAAVTIMICTSVMAGAQHLSAQGPTTNRPWAYLLLDGSYLTDDCPNCDRLSVEWPMRGSFTLRLLEQNFLVSRYAVEDIHFTAEDRPYTVTGSGTFEIGGEVAIRREMSLELSIDDSFGMKACYMTNAPISPDRAWPMLDIYVDQTNGTSAQVFHLRLAAAPLREIWFSAANAFTPGKDLGNPVSGGDLVSMSGHVVKRNNQLTGQLGIMPSVPDLGLDGVDILPGGEIAFSVTKNIFSEQLGPLQHGDLLSSHGALLYHNSDLLAAFNPQPAMTDAGLDAVHVLDTGEIVFSVQSNVFSKRLNAAVHPGDLLSNSGQVWRSNQQLLGNFHPIDKVKDYGLDALYVWPHGEIWFSTEIGFQDQVMNRTILPGDLLSDAGYVVFGNLELLNAFAPVEDLSDFGLDALYVVSDATPPAPEPHLNFAIDRPTGNVAFSWQSQGRVFQILSTGAITDPFQPLSPVVPDLSWKDVGAIARDSQGYYQLRQW